MTGAPVNGSSPGRSQGLTSGQIASTPIQAGSDGTPRLAAWSAHSSRPSDHSTNRGAPAWRAAR